MCTLLGGVLFLLSGVGMGANNETRDIEKFWPETLCFFMLGLPLTRAHVDVHQTAGLNRRNIIYRNIRIWVEKKPIVSVTYENERISIKNSLPYIKCVLRVSCVVHGPIYGRLMDCTVNGTVNGLLYLKTAEKEKRLGVEEKATAGNSFRVMKSWGMTYLTGWTKSWLRAGCNLSCNG